MKRLRTAVTTFTGFILIIMLASVFIFNMKFSGSTFDTGGCAFSDGWSCDYGEKVTLNLLEPINGSSCYNIIHKIDGSALNGESLCFESNNVLFNVYANGRLIYDFHPQLGSIYGKFYGTAVHTVALPALSEGSEDKQKMKAVCEI